MKLITQILNELGGDSMKAMTIIPSFGGYFKCVKSISELSSDKIVLLTGGGKITLAGEKLGVGEYFEGDVFIRGAIGGRKIDEIK